MPLPGLVHVNSDSIADWEIRDRIFNANIESPKRDYWELLETLKNDNSSCVQVLRGELALEMIGEFSDYDLKINDVTTETGAPYCVADNVRVFDCRLIGFGSASVSRRSLDLAPDIAKQLMFTYWTSKSTPKKIFILAPSDYAVAETFFDALSRQFCGRMSLLEMWKAQYSSNRLELFQFTEII